MPCESNGIFVIILWACQNLSYISLTHDQYFLLEVNLINQLNHTVTVKNPLIMPQPESKKET